MGIRRNEILQPLAAMVAKILVGYYFRSTRRTGMTNVVLRDMQIAVVNHTAVILFKNFAFLF